MDFFIFLVKYIFYKYENKIYNINKVNIIVRNHYIFTHNSYIWPLLHFFFLDINSQYKLLADLTAVDWLTERRRISDLEKTDSIVSLYPSASWFEREIWDLFGILFLEHGDLRRILTDYGFIGFPLRKDFPLSGYQEIYYDYIVESIIYRKIKLVQTYRLFQKK